MNFSFWDKEQFLQEYDVMVIGSGIVGLSTAIHLHKLNPKWHIAVLERGAIPWGGSTRNAGFACFGSAGELLDDLETLSEEALVDLVERRWLGLERMKELLGENRLQYEAFGGYEFFQDADEAKRVEEALPRLNRLLYPLFDEEIYRAEAPDFGFKGLYGGIKNAKEAQLHPGKMMTSFLILARQLGIAIFNGVDVKDWEESTRGIVLETQEGLHFRGQRLAICTNGFAHRWLPDQVQPARNQVLITQPIEGLRIKGNFHLNKGYYYFRNVGNRLLLGGGRHLAKDSEQTDQFGFTESIQEALLSLLKEQLLPGQAFEIEQWWSGIMGLGPNKIPQVARHTERQYSAVRLGGMGVALGTKLGQELAEKIHRED